MAKQYGKAHKSLAQSGGRNSSFGGGKGGGASNASGGGSRGTKKVGKTKLPNGTGVNIRQTGGDAQRGPLKNKSSTFGSTANGPYAVPSRRTSLPKELGGSV